ncbi:MAG: hypothetical protein CVU54_16375 [Deltaproteobacteria bacterium HGW-Deltaproteobacteria-12]|jgi:hypothetical protein|nr:MAG: hypothetical protein CVU54_16375 [Deltaproteobacteria bacterium HGW-Deltaproteobacteria-12]
MATANNKIKIFLDQIRRKPFQEPLLFFIVPILVISLVACAPKFGQVVISKPDEYKQIYEAKEKYILNATARVFQEKNMGANVRIDREKERVETDYIVEGEWRTKSIAQVRKLNWRERELVLSVITEKKTETGWEMRRLLQKEQYLNLFDTIELAIFQEIARME